MRVGVDAQIAEVSHAGIGQFTAALSKWLPLVDRETTYVSLRPSHARDFSVPGRWWWDQVTVPRLVRRERVDVLLKPGFSGPVRPSVPTVVVLHDLAARLFPEQLHRPSAWFYGRWLPWTLRFAARIIAVSEYTAAEAIRELKLPSDRLRVALQGVEQPFPTTTAAQQAALAHFKLPEKFLLHVGTLEPRKNLTFLVRVFAQFRRRFPSYDLVLAGSEGWLAGDVRRAVTQHGLDEHVRLLGGVNDVELQALYHQARVLAFPSWYEGFGRPPLEAMAAGTPVVAAVTSSIPEVVGQAGILVNGYEEGAWVTALASAAEDEERRRHLRRLGRDRSRQFTWERTARIVAKVVHEAVVSG
ncbi:MAG: glycosyltransferase family 4 protein [Candidatus Kerfeldbacteria bacterium]|nr:glycosyltransferase family 4 protein [Candidatus Kerfeldbacteria bacterium]